MSNHGTPGRVLALVVAGLAFAACRAVGYGPAVDRSLFVSARLNEAGTVLYTAQGLVYRPAAGWRAFPDGGIPLYLLDRNVIGRVDVSTGRAERLYAIKNTQWQNGQGQLNIHDFKGNIAIIVEGGQRRDNYLTDVHFYLLDLSRETFSMLPLKTDLAARGRDIGYFYLLDRRGTLLFVTCPLGSRKVELPTNELWLRRPSGEYALVAKGADYYGEAAGEVIYWQLETRAQRAYDIVTGATRALDRYIPADLRPEVGVDLSPDRKRLELSRRHGDTWKVEKTLLAIDNAK